MGSKSHSSNSFSGSFHHPYNHCSLTVCIHRIKFPNILKDIVEVVGTFVNGTLHGTAKLVLEDQDTVIANFENGTLHGKIIKVLTKCTF